MERNVLVAILMGQKRKWLVLAKKIVMLNDRGLLSSIVIHWTLSERHLALLYAHMLSPHMSALLQM